MRVFWHQGGLHIEPESDQERKALVMLVDNAKFGKPPGITVPGGSSELGSDQLFEAVIGDHQAGPRSLPGQRNNKQLVVSINKLA